MMQFFSISLIVLLLLTSVALPAVPPLRKEVLQNDASLILVGRVARVTTTTREVGKGEDTIFNVEIEVADVEKGDATLGEKVNAETWKPGRRPDGWVGPQGQNVRPDVGQLVRCFLRGSAKEGYTFLEPNGLELLKPGPASQP